MTIVQFKGSEPQINTRSSPTSRDVHTGRFSDYDTFEEQIESFEKEAAEKCYSAIQDMREVELSGWFNRLLVSRIIPELKRIGYDESLAWAIFKMAAPAWESMGPITDEIVWFNPDLMDTIEEIRAGVLSKARRNAEQSLLLSEMNPQDLLTLVKEAMNHEELFWLAEDICTSWIILPRAYDYLEERHSQLLPVYLKYLSRETSPEFWKIMARVTIEFLGNFALKHISDIHPKERMAEAIFYGYAAMFWQNLRNPPSSFEDREVFLNFLHWVKMFKNRLMFLNRDMARTIENMKANKEKVFPAINAFGLSCNRIDDVGSFMITLRHGSPGIAAALKCFGAGGLLHETATDCLIPYVAIPATLWTFFRKIKKKFHAETLKTQESIREFLWQLRAAYDLQRLLFGSVEAGINKQLRFVGQRVTCMIRDFAKSMH